MKLLVSLSLLAGAAIGVLGAEEELQIDVTLPVECDRKTKNGDSIHVHYRGTLKSNGEKFDASSSALLSDWGNKEPLLTPGGTGYDRGTPFNFNLGGGMVIKGFVAPRISTV